MGRITLIGFCFWSLGAHAGRGVSDTGNENCTYAGLKLDGGATPGTKGKVNSIADDFSGLVVCTDPQTKRVYETFTLAKGKRSGETRKYDRSSGRLTELLPYKAGQLDGCVKKYDDRSGFETWEYCVQAGVPQGLQKAFDRETGVLTSIKWVNPEGKSVPASDIQFNVKGQPTELECGPQTLIGADDLWCGRGDREGKVTLYTSDGLAARTVSYRNGKRHGWTHTFDIEGKLRSEERFENGRSVEMRRFNPADGGQKFESIAIGADTEKDIVYFDQSKKPRLVMERSKGRLLKELAYFANGQLSYEKLAKGDDFELKQYADDGTMLEQGLYFPRWGKEIGIWGLAPKGTIKRYREGVLVEEATYDDHGRRDGLQRYFDLERPKRVLRREHFQGGKLRWTEDAVETGDVLRRDYAEDGSVSSEVLMSKTKSL